MERIEKVSTNSVKLLELGDGSSSNSPGETIEAAEFVVVVWREFKHSFRFLEIGFGGAGFHLDNVFSGDESIASGDEERGCKGSWQKSQQERSGMHGGRLKWSSERMVIYSIEAVSTDGDSRYLSVWILE